MYVRTIRPHLQVKPPSTPPVNDAGVSKSQMLFFGRGKYLSPGTLGNKVSTDTAHSWWFDRLMVPCRFLFPDSTEGHPLNVSPNPPQTLYSSS